MSKSMVSRRISRMEEDLGTPLLSRTTRGISPTEAGLEFKARSERILADLAEAREAVASRPAAWPAGCACRCRWLRDPARRARAGGDGAAPSEARTRCRGHRPPRRPDRRTLRCRDPAGHLQGFEPGGPADRADLYQRRLASPDYMARHGRPASPLWTSPSMNASSIAGATSPADWFFRGINRRWVPIRPGGRPAFG